VYLNVDEVNLFKAAAGRNISLIRFFVSRGVNINTLDEERTSILHVAARHGSIPVVEELIQSNANLNLTDMAGWTRTITSFNQHSMSLPSSHVPKCAKSCSQQEPIVNYVQEMVCKHVTLSVIK
jgi:hypothetical protein